MKKANSKIECALLFQIYKRGLALVQQSDRSKMASEFLQQITKLNMKLGRYDQAKKFVKEEIEKYVEVRVGIFDISLYR